ncbi:MAG TPA: phosphotransferase, partial [Gemmataceae bacterium]|nr:phosphotransferase [Gemmataceae bacterium]
GARLAGEGERRRALLAEGADGVRLGIAIFREAGVLPPLALANLYLAGLLTDHARALPDPRAQEAPLREAREALSAAEESLWDSYDRAYLELEWAWYYRTTGPAASAENHLTSARLHARACGNHNIETDVGSALGTHLCGPAGDDRWDVVLPPGTRLEMTVFARDWRGRPVPGYDLRATLSGPGSGDTPGVSLAPTVARTDDLGRVSFAVAAAADARPGTFEVEVRDHGVFREAHARVHVQPFAVRLHPSLESRPPLADDDRVVLRHLFGPRFREVLLRKEFGSGLSGSRVFLVEPLLAPPAAAGGRGEGLRGQPCLVKIGGRRQIGVEVERYEEHVKDILPPNVSRIASSAVWGDRAGIRMSLAGDQDWDRASDEIDWLVRVPAMEAHHLLDDLFIRDLGACWYANTPAAEASMPLSRAYGRMMPVLLTVREPRPGGGLLTHPPREPRLPITEGLRPPGEERLAEAGQTVYLGRLRVEDVFRHGEEWEYELLNPRDGLRVALRTRVPPRYFDKDGVADNLVGQERHVLGAVEEFVFDRLLDALRVGVATCPVDPDAERLALSDDGAALEVRTRDESLSLRTPLFSLHKYLEQPLRHRRSIIHGDLHTRNVIVSPGGMPYYIDFSDTGVGPTLFDFIKHESYLWAWSLGGVPEAEAQPPCSLTEAVRLMRALTRRERRFPAALTLPDFLGGDRHGWPAKFYQVIGTVRSLARDHSASPPEQEAPDYFLPLAVYSALMLRWCHPDRTDCPRKKAVYARQGVLLTLLAGLLLNEGVVAAPA